MRINPLSHPPFPSLFFLHFTLFPFSCSPLADAAMEYHFQCNYEFLWCFNLLSCCTGLPHLKSLDIDALFHGRFPNHILLYLWPLLRCSFNTFFLFLSVFVFYPRKAWCVSDFLHPPLFKVLRGLLWATELSAKSSLETHRISFPNVCICYPVSPFESVSLPLSGDWVC